MKIKNCKREYDDVTGTCVGADLIATQRLVIHVPGVTTIVTWDYMTEEEYGLINSLDMINSGSWIE